MEDAPTTILRQPPKVPIIPSSPISRILPITLISLLLLFSLSLSAFLLYQNLQLQQKIASLKAQPTPTPTPLPAEAPAKEGDPTANWKTYINNDFGFSFSYPEELTYLYDHLKGGNILLQNFDGSSARKELDSDFQMVITADNANSKPLEDYPKQWETELGKLPTETILVGGITAIKGFSGQKYQAVPTVWFSKKTTTFMVQLSHPKSTNKIWFDQILSTFRFTEPNTTIIPAPSPLLPSGWTARPFPTYGITLYSPSNWKSSVQDYPETPSSLIRFWQGTTPDTATIQLDIKNSWANTGDAPYLPKNYTVNGNIAAVRVDPPQKTEKTLDRYQTNVYFEHGSKIYVFTCVHNWIPEQLQICNTMLQTIQFSQ